MALQPWYIAKSAPAHETTTMFGFTQCPRAGSSPLTPGAIMHRSFLEWRWGEGGWHIWCRGEGVKKCRAAAELATCNAVADCKQR